MGGDDDVADREGAGDGEAEPVALGQHQSVRAGSPSGATDAGDGEAERRAEVQAVREPSRALGAGEDSPAVRRPAPLHGVNLDPHGGVRMLVSRLSIRTGLSWSGAREPRVLTTSRGDEGTARRLPGNRLTARHGATSGSSDGRSRQMMKD
ncbi:hypothetical protein GCM10009593_30250 [Microlunatus antarcticus]